MISNYELHKKLPMYNLPETKNVYWFYAVSSLTLLFYDFSLKWMILIFCSVIRNEFEISFKYVQNAYSRLLAELLRALLG